MGTGRIRKKSHGSGTQVATISYCRHENNLNNSDYSHLFDTKIKTPADLLNLIHVSTTLKRLSHQFEGGYKWYEINVFESGEVPLVVYRFYVSSINL